MNIFFLDKDPQICASYHCDKHVVKMIVESCQMLSTTLRSKGYTNDFLYKSCFENHPCTLWVKQNDANFQYLLDLAYYLCEQYNIRYKKTHKCLLLVLRIRKMFKPNTSHQITVPALAMPDDVKVCNGKTFEDCVQSYKNYYIVYKTFAVYKYTQTPDFMKNKLVINF